MFNCAMYNYIKYVFLNQMLDDKETFSDGVLLDVQ